MKILICVVLLALSAAAQAPAPTVSQILDRDFRSMERQLVPLAEAMPADKYGFVPASGEFKTVRTFGQQVSHVAAVIYAASAAVAGEENPSEMGPGENGPASLKTKDDIVKYLKDAVAYGHKAMGSLTDKNLTDLVQSPFGKNKVPRLAMATEATAHSYDHYGQMVVYLRLNGIIPPASRR
jgi:hypothetical protein